MSFILPEYHAPDFNAERFIKAPCVKMAESPKDGVVPENYHATTIYPEYFNIGGEWRLAEESRMDCVAIWKDGKVQVVEFRNIKKGDLVLLGRTEDASDGIYVHFEGFRAEDDEFDDNFAFRQGRSRETAYSKDYDSIYDLLEYEKEYGKIVWVMGPACAFDADSRSAFASLVKRGYVNGLLAGNALATHDLEASYLRTALGQDIYTQRSQPNGHYNHIDTINKVRNCGSIKQFIADGCATDGIMYEIVKNDVPFVLCGSIRDDGPLPEVFGNVYQGQDAMRNIIRSATTVICMASTLHTIATGNMTPSFRVIDGIIRPVYFYSVDISEFAVNKLRDRGSLSVKTIVTNVQDFVVNVSKGTK
jgi:lysine-ketoglutarate reductase/saccharopine dehydrogenase-like protein (TIGR00300 family)